MQEMNRNEMIDFLRKINDRSRLLTQERERLQKTAMTMNDAIEVNTFKKFDGEGGSGHFGSPDKVLRILLASFKDVSDDRRDLALRMQAIYEKEEEIRYVRRCVGRLEVEEKILVTEAYINNELGESMVARTGMCMASLYKTLNGIIDRLVVIYNAGCQSVKSENAENMWRELAALGGGEGVLCAG